MEYPLFERFSKICNLNKYVTQYEQCESASARIITAPCNYDNYNYRTISLKFAWTEARVRKETPFMYRVNANHVSKHDIRRYNNLGLQSERI